MSSAPRLVLVFKAPIMRKLWPVLRLIFTGRPPCPQSGFFQARAIFSHLWIFELKAAQKVTETVSVIPAGVGVQMAKTGPILSISNRN